jgi:HSP20 family molecular chaperone IbpA
MKKLFLSSAALMVSVFLSFTATAQTIDKPLPHFDKLIASPFVNVVLTEGDQEHIRLEYTGVEPQKINYAVKGKTLRIYLDDARITVKQRKHYDEDGYEYKKPIYENVKITAYVTYRQLRSLEVRGEEKVSCETPLNVDDFTLKIYGQSKVTLAGLETGHLFASLYGENKLAIQSGSSQTQKYRVYGENQIDTKNFTSKHISASSIGESRLNLHASDELRVTTVGESDVYNAGQGHTSKRLTLGRSNVQHSR